jgi:hypothetical protein
MAIILKVNKVNLFVSSAFFVFWYHSPNVLDTPHICNISRLRVNNNLLYLFVQDAAFNVTNFESRITHLLYTAVNTTEHGQVSQCLGFTKKKKSLASSIQRLGDVLHEMKALLCPA